MNNAKIAAALHALADAFLEGEEPAAPAAVKGKGKTKTSELTPAAQVVIAQVAAEQPAPALADAEPTKPLAPSITKEQLNKIVLAVAAKNRAQALAILAKFGGHTNTVTLPPEQWQAVYDAFEEEVAKIDAAAVQVANAPLV